MVIISSLTGLLVGICFYLMLVPGPEGTPSVLRIIIYGFLGVFIALYGMASADRARRQTRRMWGEQ